MFVMPHNRRSVRSQNKGVGEALALERSSLRSKILRSCRMERNSASIGEGRVYGDYDEMEGWELRVES